MWNGLRFAALLCVSGVTSGQNSYYFSSPQPLDSEASLSVSKNWHGKYENPEGVMAYEFSEDGVFAVSVSVMRISRESVRESSQYDVRNGFLFGVVENDSVPCETDGEHYVFGIRNRACIAGEGSNNVLKKLDASRYLINYLENGHYVPVLFTFTKNKLEIADFDYELEGEAFPYIAEKERSESSSGTTVLLKPTQAEFRELQANAFVNRPVYKRKKAN